MPLGLPECCHLLYRVTTEHCCSRCCGHTNLQIPVDDPINMAVMDTLKDLLYAVAEGGRVMKRRMIVMEQMEEERQTSEEEKERKKRG